MLPELFEASWPQLQLDGPLKYELWRNAAIRYVVHVAILHISKFASNPHSSRCKLEQPCDLG